MDLGLKDKVAIVTGGSRGIGRAIALGLAAEGCNVAICARGEEKLRETEAEIKAKGVKTFAMPLDVTDGAAIEAFVERTASELGGVDILVNNAGGSRPGDDDEAWQGVIDVNLLAAVRASRAVVPYMRTRGGGSIVNITSIWGREGGGAPTYNAAKAAMTSHAKNLGLTLAGEGIRVNSVAPGSIRFPGGGWDRRVQADPEGMARFVKDNIPSGRFGTPEEVANAVVFLCSPAASWVTAASLNVDGGQSRSNI
jgi:3-oxoacyl-[acyl-carrier protein] reductase